jgi:Fe-Mn family superoxide dismutase
LPSSQPSHRRHLSSSSRHNNRPHKPSEETYDTNEKIPSLGKYDEEFWTHGVPGLFSRMGFRMGWTQYEEVMMTKVRNLVAGEAIDVSNLRGIAIQYARDPLNASLFNHASQAHNNHFFYGGLSTNATPLREFEDMKNRLEKQFGSIDNFRISFVESAAGMFGPGYTWLVWDPTGKEHAGAFKILNTYSAGTPYGEVGHRRQGMDMATNNVGAMGQYSAAGRKDGQVAPGSTRLFPLLCVSTWQHVYLYDYGPGGKREYLNTWWDAINWAQAHEYYKAATKGTNTAAQSMSNAERRARMYSR